MVQKNSGYSLYEKENQKLTKEWHTKLLRTCFESMRENNLNDKRFSRKITQVAQRIRNLDMAKAF